MVMQVNSISVCILDICCHAIVPDFVVLPLSQTRQQRRVAMTLRSRRGHRQVNSVLTSLEAHFRADPPWYDTAVCTLLQLQSCACGPPAYTQYSAITACMRQCTTVRRMYIPHCCSIL
eukprot:9039-Heterococcus_DN1.PRE.1